MKYLYRIVNALLAAAIFPVALLLEFVILRLSTSIVDAGVEETFTLKQLIGFFTGNDRLFGFTYAQISSGDKTFTFPEALDPVKGQLIAVAVTFAIAIIAAVFIIFWSIFSDKRIPVIISSVAGIAAVIAMNICFNSAAAPLLDGTINVIELFSTGWLVSLLGEIVAVDTLCFAGFHNGMIIVFVSLLIWTAAFYIVEIGEPKEEKLSEKAKKKSK
ncbi:MAG: hypothetical protein IKK63_03265 [Clostridia bacterium]|nr:hypothetical protein [Clostridia bacterium]